MKLGIKSTITLGIVALVCACSQSQEGVKKVASPIKETVISGKPTVEVRPFRPMIEGKWVGNGISYGAYRDGEGPDEESLTSKEHILEDMKILSKRWNLIRMYGTGKQSQNILEVIRDNNIPILVMQGAWISKHHTKEQNDQQVQEVIELANAFPDIVVAVNIGNEIFVDWSWHKVADQKSVVRYIRQVRAAINQPVTVNDDYNYWNKPWSKEIADEIDFIGLHGYAFWNNQTIENAAWWTDSIYTDIQMRHPQHQIAFCETGWPTSRIWNDGSHEGGLIGKANENNQKKFFDWYTKWVDEKKVASLYFEAFDENWKGGWDGKNPADKAEKHWGVYKADRSGKKVMEN